MVCWCLRVCLCVCLCVRACGVRVDHTAKITDYPCTSFHFLVGGLVEVEPRAPIYHLALFLILQLVPELI